jgi:hypothetical protein
LAVERRRNSVRVKLATSIALLAALLAAGATPAFGATPTSTSVDKSVGVTTHTSNFAMSQAECDALHQQYPKAECVVVVKSTTSVTKVAADKVGAGSISPAVLIDQSPCSSHNYFAGTYNLQMIGGGVWSYTLWTQYEGDTVCGNVEYQVVRCHQDWGVLWSASNTGCDAVPAKNRWAWWGNPSYSYADFTMTYCVPVIGGCFSIGHNLWTEVNGVTRQIYTGGH